MRSKGHDGNRPKARTARTVQEVPPLNGEREKPAHTLGPVPVQNTVRVAKNWRCTPPTKDEYMGIAHPTVGAIGRTTAGRVWNLDDPHSARRTGSNGEWGSD